MAFVVLARGAALENLRRPTPSLRDMALHTLLPLGWLLVGLVGILGMQNEGGDNRYWEKWSDEEIAARKAEAWENSSWTTTPLSGWDAAPQEVQAQPALVGANSAQPAPACLDPYAEPEVTVTPLGHSSSSAWGPCYEDAAYVVTQEQPSSSSSSSVVVTTVDGEGEVLVDSCATGGGDLPRELQTRPVPDGMKKLALRLRTGRSCTSSTSLLHPS